MFYLAAAVSDFYIPASEMPEHKIQSLEGAPAGEASLGMALSAIPLSCPLLASKVRLLRTGCG